MAKTDTTPRSWPRRLRGWMVQLSILLLLLLSLEAFLGRDSLGMRAPQIDSMLLSGEHFSLQRFRGKAAVVHFWASWCPVCELEQGMVEKLSGEVPMITVAMQSGTADELVAYLQAQGVDYPVINDEHGRHAASYGVKAVPASFILDREGRVRFATRGYTTGWGIRLRLWLAGLF